MNTETQSRIENIIDQNSITLFMKGEKDFPECGFSAKAVAILEELNANYTTVNVLEDPEIRQGIKEFGNWPTIPQLYINKELVGGCDIMMEMFQSGELKDLIHTQ